MLCDSSRSRSKSICVLFGRDKEALPFVRSDDDVHSYASPAGASVILGDPTSRKDARGWSGNSVSVSCDGPSRSIRVLTSVTGFPPIFRVDSAQWSGVCSSVALLRALKGIELRPNIDGILDLCYTGFPVGYRTLFSQITLMPAGREMLLPAFERPIELRRWEPSAPVARERPAADRMDIFADVIAGLETANSRFSLSGGLDTRAIFAGLVQVGRMPECFTVSGPTPTLDAVLARELCEAYGVPHRLVPLGESFRTNLWELSSRASLATHGTSSLSCAPQLYCYDYLGLDDSSSTALSGFLGNQVGRGASEGVTARLFDFSLLSPTFRARAKERSAAPPWYAHGVRLNGEFDKRFLIQEENLFASLAGYCAGHERAIQRSPYTDVYLVSATLTEHGPSPSRRLPRLGFRASEIQNRFFGTGSTGFQRRFIKQVGGWAASYPINYGWTARGTLSVKGLRRGARAFAEDLLTFLSRRTRIADVMRDVSGLRGFATHLQVDSWIRDLREPILDHLDTEAIKSAGIVDVRAAKKAANGFFQTDQQRPHTIITMMDLMLAIENFKISL